MKNVSCRLIRGIYTILCFFNFLTFGETFRIEDKGRHIPVQRRFLIGETTSTSYLSVEQFASCFLTCTPGYEKLIEACCKTGAGVVCSNLPWTVLKPILGKCPGLLTAALPAVSEFISLEQFAACYLDCVVGYEKLTTACCQSGLDVVCSNLPWSMLIYYLGTCTSTMTNNNSNTPLPSSIHTMTSPITTTTTTTTTTATFPKSTSSMTTLRTYWLPWGSWGCEIFEGTCFQKRSRNCSTGLDSDCNTLSDGVSYDIGFCTILSCPEFYLTTPPTTMATTQQVTCQDDPRAIGCTDTLILREVCIKKESAWKLCRKSCGLCDTCWDYLNCSAHGAQQLFCGNDNYAVQYCRKTCGKCDHKPVDVTVNKCGDPVSSEDICEYLQSETCICNDPDIRNLCGHYCNNQCLYHPYKGSDCRPARRRKRDAIVNELLLSKLI
ncbi:uncharacterized protein LOC132736652 [Ruditapes philippinarum]|uniref:uncharacterized protein LOC132736652 n=1 Tax=Ruditapes philippinarum TaxID=129788 RepID=UPI00295B4810|nr:uncharacterized protein LOC132736652 [Ruditapes philippinarum]